MNHCGLRIEDCGLTATTRRGRAVAFFNPQSAIRNPQSCRGFTLVEILATLALVAIILPVAMAGLSLALATADVSRHETEAARLAQSKMAEIIAQGDFQTTLLGGDFAPDNPEYRWTAVLSDYDASLQLKQVDVQVSWNSRQRDRSVTLLTLVYTGASS